VTLKEVFLDRDPERGELVVFRNPEQRRRHWIKRVIATGGDEVEWRENGEVLVNGDLLKQMPTDDQDEYTEENGGRDYTIRLSADLPGGRSSGQLIVPDYQCFVLGDNRFASRDRREFGPIAYTVIMARQLAKVWGGLGALK
jgi:signal peptidase I